MQQPLPWWLSARASFKKKKGKHMLRLKANAWLDVHVTTTTTHHAKDSNSMHRWRCRCRIPGVTCFFFRRVSMPHRSRCGRTSTQARVSPHAQHVLCATCRNAAKRSRASTTSHTTSANTSSRVPHIFSLDHRMAWNRDTTTSWLVFASRSKPVNARSCIICCNALI